MMGSSRSKEKGKAPAYANSISPNVDGDYFDSFLDMPLSVVGWEDAHRSFALGDQGVPEPIGNTKAYSMSPDSLQNFQTNVSSNVANTNLQDPLLSDWNMGWGQKYMNQGHNAIASDGISAFSGGSSFESFSRPQVNRDFTSSPSLFCPRDTAREHSRNTAIFSTDQSRVHGKFEGNFLSLGLGSTSETVTSSQLDRKEISHKLKEAASNELKIACAREATRHTYDGSVMGSQSSNSGFSNRFGHVSQTTSTNNDDGFMGSSSYHMKQMQQSDRQLKRLHARKATCQTLDADYMSFQRNNNGFSNQFSNVGGMTSTNYEVGVHSTLSNSGSSSSRQHASQMQQNDSWSIRCDDLDHYKGNQSVHSGTLGGNSGQFPNSQQRNLKSPEFVKPSWMTSYHTPSGQLRHVRSPTVNGPSYAGQVMPQNATPTQVLGGNLYSHRTAAPQVSWVGRGSAGMDAPFPKRLGVESSARNIPQSSQGHLTRMGPSLQNTGRTDGAPVHYPVNYQEPFFTFGQSQNELIRLPKSPQSAPSTNASSFDSQSQKLDSHFRRHHKRTAVPPQSASHWVQRQKKVHPTIHHSMPKPHVPVTTAHVHSSIPVRSQTKPAGPVAAHLRPVIPHVANIKPRVPVPATPAVSHIKWKDPDSTSKLSGYKCFLCKRDLALTSEGPVIQPTAPPSAAILPCGHAFHDQCLQNITPDDQAKDPPCIPCAIGEN